MKYSNSKLTFLSGIPAEDASKFNMNHITITGNSSSAKVYWALRTLLDLVSTQTFPTKRKKILLHTGEHHVLQLIELMGSMLLAYGYPTFDSVNENKLADLRYIQSYLGAILDFFHSRNYDLVTTNDSNVLATHLMSEDTDQFAFILTDHYPHLFAERLAAISAISNATWIETRVKTADSSSIIIRALKNEDMFIATNLMYDQSVTTEDN